jgi:hypothetical protein
MRIPQLANVARNPVNRPWLSIAATAARNHNERGWSLTDWMGTIPCDFGVCVDQTPEEMVLLQKGRNLNPVNLRRFISHHFRNPVVMERTGILWTAYDKEEDTSYVGLGRVLHWEEYDELKKRQDLKTLVGNQERPLG